MTSPGIVWSQFGAAITINGLVPTHWQVFFFLKEGLFLLAVKGKGEAPLQYALLNL